METTRTQTTFRFRPPHSGRFTLVMNLATKLDLNWDSEAREWFTTDAVKADQMRRAGATES